MSHLTEAESKVINDLNLLGTCKTTISQVLHCSRKTVYNHLEKHKIRDGSLQKKKRRKVNRKLTEQVKANIFEYVLQHRFCTNKEIIAALGLEIQSKQAISNGLKELGICSYVAVVKQYISNVNRQKRLVF
jgi:transposase